jgi:hypothetical protein
MSAFEEDIPYSSARLSLLIPFEYKLIGASAEASGSHSDCVIRVIRFRYRNQQRRPFRSIPCHSMLEHSGLSVLCSRWFVHCEIARSDFCIRFLRCCFQPQWRSLLTINRFGLLEPTAYAVGFIPLSLNTRGKQFKKAKQHGETLHPTTSFLTACR